MTRQLFPSPSQGALICAGGREEGRLAAAPASVAAGRQDPAPHWRLDERIRAFLRGFWTLLVILLLQAELRLQRATELAFGAPSYTRVGLGVLCCPFAPAELPPTKACMRLGGSGGQATI